MARYFSFVDGGCSKNGQQGSQAYGSCLVYKVEDDAPDVTRTPVAAWALARPVISDPKFKLGMNNNRNTNNSAEAQSMHHLMTRLFSMGILCPDNQVLIHSDSQLVINQVLGNWTVNNKVLLDIYRQIYTIFDRYESRYGTKVGQCMDIVHIPGTLMKQIIGH